MQPSEGTIATARRSRQDTNRAPEPAVTSDARGRLVTTLWLTLFAVLFAALLVRNYVLGAYELGMLRVGPLRIASFGPLVSLGVLFGIHLMRRWSLATGLPWDDVFGAVGWMLVVGFVGSHVLDVALYRPEDFFDPGVLLDFRSDYSSFGGVLCGGLAAWLAFRRAGIPVLRGMECTLYGFTGGWLFGRLACFSVHDHPGVATSSPLGVEIDGVMRHDLGLYELIYTIVIFAILQWTTQRRRYDGWVIALVATTYAPVRFALDFLRVRDATYGGLTPAQWVCIPVLAIGLYYCARGRQAA
ncbi:MAG TPA: prolipoprotein diacylglyceryl transferase family protein [Candidatus Binatia bacterium]